MVTGVTALSVPVFGVTVLLKGVTRLMFVPPQVVVVVGVDEVHLAVAVDVRGALPRVGGRRAAVVVVVLEQLEHRAAIEPAHGLRVERLGRHVRGRGVIGPHRIGHEHEVHAGERGVRVHGDLDDAAGADGEVARERGPEARRERVHRRVRGRARRAEVQGEVAVGDRHSSEGLLEDQRAAARGLVDAGREIDRTGERDARAVHEDAGVGHLVGGLGRRRERADPAEAAEGDSDEDAGEPCHGIVSTWMGSHSLRARRRLD
jgi:hypothetical protein